MPVSFFPVIATALCILVPPLFLIRGKKYFFVALLVSAAYIGSVLLGNYMPGWVLMGKAARGDAKSQYELARWYENHSWNIQALLLWPGHPDVLEGYSWLEKAAAQDYPPAVWLVGVRLKYGIFVPRPPDWSGPAGNVFEQPKRGQQMIDRAVRLGFQPPTDEEGYYWRVYRK